MKHTSERRVVYDRHGQTNSPTDAPGFTLGAVDGLPGSAQARAMGFIRLTATVLDSPDPLRLARFYAALLDWELGADGTDWTTVRDPQSGAAGLSFQREPLFRAPAWPAEPGRQSMQMHLDIEVEDLDAAVRRAQDLGAELETHQPQQDVRVMRDPDGHLFCLWVDGGLSA